ncbi:monovalent cation/H+ antiporter subunit D [Comamonadaceae bacterium OH2545_COT-014]|nr:monovalent cation/H+ antiporter subunit D [Comamonadaceae bacterium OH2545_COT-014]
MPHLVMAPVLLPLGTAALMLLLGDTRRPLKALVNVLSCLLGLAVSMTLVYWVQHVDGPQAVGVYLPGNWPVPYGIVLVVDRLSAMMLLLASVLGLAAVLYASARWHKAGVHFHPLFQLQLMGLAGAFLTGDLFNLFVFFEIMLTASYGLLLHGSGWPRVRAGLHYIAVNLMASTLFLVGIAMLYGVTGTLNLADMAVMVPAIADEDRGLLHAGAAIMALAFLVKAAAWPLNFWLPAAYASAAAPVSALFAIMTKLGVYAVLRLWTLLFPQDAGVSALFGGPQLVWVGLATLAFGAVGILATQHLGRMAAFAVILSSGTLLAALGFGQPQVTGAALYYAFSSTLAVSALFLVIELVERARESDERVPVISETEADEAFAFPVELVPSRDVNLDDDEEALIGRAIPAAMAFLGLSFIMCTLLIAGLPPLSGFVGKFAMLTALLNPGGLGGAEGAVPVPVWVMLALLVSGGLMATIALSRAGVRHFWAPQGRPAPRLRVIECAPVAALLLLAAAMVWQAQPVLRFTQEAARALHDPREYIGAVVTAQPVPSPVATGRGGLLKP